MLLSASTSWQVDAEMEVRVSLCTGRPELKLKATDYFYGRATEAIEPAMVKCPLF
jgi:hypothetical protein